MFNPFNNGIKATTPTSLTQNGVEVAMRSGGLTGRILSALVDGSSKTPADISQELELDINVVKSQLELMKRQKLVMVG